MPGETGTCGICGGEYDQFGHNPEPLRPMPSRCCYRCNQLFVLPARMGVKFEREDLFDLARILKKFDDTQVRRALSLMQLFFDSQFMNYGKVEVKVKNEKSDNPSDN